MGRKAEAMPSKLYFVSYKRLHTTGYYWSTPSVTRNNALLTFARAFVAGAGSRGIARRRLRGVRSEPHLGLSGARTGEADGGARHFPDRWPSPLTGDGGGTDAVLLDRTERGIQNSNRKRALSLLNSYLPIACRKVQNAQPDTTADLRVDRFDACSYS